MLPQFVQVVFAPTGQRQAVSSLVDSLFVSCLVGSLRVSCVLVSLSVSCLFSLSLCHVRWTISDCHVNNILYSSQREIKAVVRSHNEEHVSVILSHETHAHTHS